MNTPNKPRTPSSFAQDGLVALKRAAARARRIATETGTSIVVSQDGKIEHLYPPFDSEVHQHEGPGGGSLESKPRLETTMNTHEIVKRALELEPAQRVEVAESILSSLDQPDPALDALWLDEAERRLAAYRKGLVKGIPAEDVVGKR